MKFKHILSLLLIAGCLSAFIFVKSSSLLAKKSVVLAEKGLIKMSIIYPYAEGKTFDMKYYETKHMPMVAGWLGSNLVKYTIEKGLPNGDKPSTYMAVGSFYIKDKAAYQKALTPHYDALGKDIPKYTNISPVFWEAEVVK